MTIDTPDAARAYLRCRPRASLLRLALEGVQLAGTIAARQQPGSQQAAAYQAAARVLATGLQLDEAQGTYDRLVAHRGRLLRYYDEAPDGDRRKLDAERQLAELGTRIREAEEALSSAADAAEEEGIA